MNDAFNSAAAVARQALGNNTVLHLDGSQYTGKSDISKLIGSPPGYVPGDGMAAGSLPDPWKAAKHQIIIFDEIEKADPQVLKDFLAAMDQFGGGTVINGASNGGLVLNASASAAAEAMARVQAEEMAAAAEQMIAHATILQQPLSVGRPLSFRAKFGMF